MTAGASRARLHAVNSDLRHETVSVGDPAVQTLAIQHAAHRYVFRTLTFTGTVSPSVNIGVTA